MATTPKTKPVYQSFAEIRPRNAAGGKGLSDGRFGKAHAQALGLNNHRLTRAEKKRFQADALKIIGKPALASALRRKGYSDEKIKSSIGTFIDGKFGKITRVAAELLSDKSRSIAPKGDARPDIAGSKVMAAARAQQEQAVSAGNAMPPRGDAPA